MNVFVAKMRRRHIPTFFQAPSGSLAAMIARAAVQEQRFTAMQTELAECDALTLQAHALSISEATHQVPLAELTPEQQRLRDARAEQQKRMDEDRRKLELERQQRQLEQEARVAAEARQAELDHQV